MIPPVKDDSPAPADGRVEPEPYAPPVLGARQSLAHVTLFSGSVDPDGGVVNFGD